MATASPVEIVIELVDSVSEELGQIKGELEAIDASSLDIDMDIHAEDEIATTEAQLDAMARDRTVDVDTSLPGIMGAGGGGDGGGISPGVDAGRVLGTRDNVDVSLRNPARMMGGDGGGISDMWDRDQISSFGRVVNRVRPRMMQLWDVMAAMIPVFISFGAAAIGVAGALGAVATAGIAIGGLGLIGWGNDAGQSLGIAAEKAQTLATRLGEVMRPAGTTFAPILEGWMQGAPGQVQQLVGPIQDLAVFADTLSAAGAGFVDWVRRAVTSMAAMDDIIGQIVLRFGELAGGFIIEFMENMVMFASRNQAALIRLAGSLREVLGALLNISIVAVTTISTLSPLVEIIGGLAQLLNTKLGRGLITSLTLLYAVNSAVNLLSTSILTKYITSILTAIGFTEAWIASLSTLQTLLLTTGVGAALAVGGLALNEFILGGGGAPGGGGGGGGMSGGNTYINVQGDVGQREMDRLIDQTPSVAREEMAFNNDMSQ